MIITMNAGVQETDPAVVAVCDKALAFGLKPEVAKIPGTKYDITQVFLKDGERVRSSSVPEYIFEGMDQVSAVQRVTPPSVSLAHNGTDHYHRFSLGSVEIGTGLPCRLVGGPCTVDRHVGQVAENLKKIGITMMRGGCWKPRSGPDSFPGFGVMAVSWLVQAAKNQEMEAVFTEVLESEHIRVVADAVDRIGYTGTVVLWVGARTGNPILLRELGRQKRFPVMLKNGLDDQGVEDMAKRADWVLARESVWDGDGQLIPDKSLTPGNNKVILCLRGTKKTDRLSPYRFRPNHDWTGVIHRNYWSPVCIDPSHSAGRENLVFPNVSESLRHNPSLLMVEGGYNGDYRGLCDAEQSLLLSGMRAVALAVGEHNRVSYGRSTF